MLGVDEEENWLFSITDLVFGDHCKLHVGAVAAKRALANFSCEAAWDDVHIALKPLIDSSHSIRARARQFVMQVVSFDSSNTWEWISAEKCWIALGVSIDMLPTFEDVNPRWQPSTRTLFVRSELSNDPDGFKKIELIYTFVLTWSYFIHSRFAGVGPSARKWLLSVFLGLDALYNDMKHDDDVHKPHLNGYDKMTQPGRIARAIIVIILSTRSNSCADYVR